MPFRIVKLFTHKIKHVRYLPDELSLNFNHQFVKREKNEQNSSQKNKQRKKQNRNR